MRWRVWIQTHCCCLTATGAASLLTTVVAVRGAMDIGRAGELTTAAVRGALAAGRVRAGDWMAGAGLGCRVDLPPDIDLARNCSIKEAICYYWRRKIGE